MKADLNQAFAIEDLETEIAPAGTNESTVIEIILIYLFLPC